VTSIAEREVLELLREEPELLAIADALVATSARPRARRRAALLVAAACALVLVAVGVAFGGRLYDAFFGRPAPHSVKHAIATLTRKNAILPAEFRSPAFVVSKTRGLLQVTTPAGAVDLWEVPLRAGGTCTFAQADRRPAKRAPAAGPCTTPHTRQSPILWSAVHVHVGHARVRILEGHVVASVTSLELRRPDGSTRPVPLADGYFLTALPESNPTELVARGGGHVVATAKVLPIVLGQCFGGDCSLQRGMTDAAVIRELTARVAPVFLAIPRGGRCAHLYDHPGAMEVCRGPGGRLGFGLSIMSGGVLAAYAGDKAAMLEVNYAEGPPTRAPLIGLWALYLLPLHRTEVSLTARRADGSVIETVPIPQF
jgi:hypothetical protein